MMRFTIGGSALSLAIGLSSVAMAQGGCNPNGGITSNLIRGIEGLNKAQAKGGAGVGGVLINRLTNNGGPAGEFVGVTADLQGNIIGGECTDAELEDEQDLDPSAPN